MNQHTKSSLMTAKLFKTLMLVAVAAAFFTACSDAPKGDQATVTAAQQTTAPATGQAYLVDTSASAVRFIGNGVGKNHPGMFRLSKGLISVDDTAVTGGSFTINMASMQVEQPEEMFQTKLKGHLLSPDFFDVAQWG